MESKNTYKIKDFLYLNILWILGSLPIFTIGASTTALLYVVMKMQRKEEVNIKKDFNKSFFLNLRQSTIMWMILLVVGAGLVLDVFFIEYAQNVKVFFKVVTMLVLIIYMFVFVFVFAIQARYDNKISSTFKYALALSFAKIQRTFLLILIWFVPVAGIAIIALYLGILALPFVLLLLIAGVSPLAYWSAEIYVELFEYITLNAKKAEKAKEREKEEKLREERKKDEEQVEENEHQMSDIIKWSSDSSKK